MRTFVAIDITSNSELHELYHDLALNLKGVNVKYTELTNLHVTLAFLGETSSELIQKISSDLRLVATELMPIELSLYKLGIFKNIHHPQVLWVGVEPDNGLKKLWNSVNLVIRRWGFIPEERGFSPHSTIGRIKKIASGQNLELFLKKYEETAFGQIRINDFVFYQSILTSQGPIYKTLERFEMGK